jgi:integrase
MPEPIFITTEKGMKIRILSPSDKDALTKAIKQDYLKTLFEVCFWTGMRFVEVQRLHEKPDLVMKERQQILLTRDEQRKVKRISPERYIPIPPQLQVVLPYFFKNKKPPTAKVWGENLQRWAAVAGITDDDCTGIVPKMTRHSIESWMFSAGIPSNWICLRQGHDSMTSLNHYQAIPFTEAEKIEIKRRLSGWGI